MSRLFVFRRVRAQPWWQALESLVEAIAEEQRAAVEDSYAELAGALIAGKHASLAEAMAEALSCGEEALYLVEGILPAGLERAAIEDLQLMRSRVAVDWRGRAEEVLGRTLPPLEELATPGDFVELAWRLRSDDTETLLNALLQSYRTNGIGVFSRYLAFRWRHGRLEGVPHPTDDRLEELVGLDRQLERLTANVERFLMDATALPTLLYGQRGSGKSTAVRALLTRYAERGLRLVEVTPESLVELPELGEQLRSAPHRYLVFVDDLTFESNDSGYAPLKTLLEGSVSERPGNVLLIATSNRRHLVRESLSDRPMPENDDVHAWDTTNERLALADRFGLTITFPGARQRDYLIVARELARARGLDPADTAFDEAAIRFADWGNGYSGRTARQFVDTLGAPTDLPV